MAGLLGGHAIANELLQLVVVAGVTQHAAGIPFHRGEQAVAELTLSREPQTVAIAAERLRDWVDEAHAAAAVGELVVHRGLAGVAAMGGLERTNCLFDALADLLTGQHLVVIPLLL